MHIPVSLQDSWACSCPVLNSQRGLHSLPAENSISHRTDLSLEDYEHRVPIWSHGRPRKERRDATILFTQKRAKNPKRGKIYQNFSGSLGNQLTWKPRFPGLQSSPESSYAQQNWRSGKGHSWCFHLIVYCRISPKLFNLKTWINSRRPLQFLCCDPSTV